jgi:hypothetical protein
MFDGTVDLGTRGSNLLEGTMNFAKTIKHERLQSGQSIAQCDS